MFARYKKKIRWAISFIAITTLIAQHNISAREDITQQDKQVVEQTFMQKIKPYIKPVPLVSIGAIVVVAFVVTIIAWRRCAHFDYDKIAEQVNKDFLGDPEIGKKNALNLLDEVNKTLKDEKEDIIAFMKTFRREEHFKDVGNAFHDFTQYYIYRDKIVSITQQATDKDNAYEEMRKQLKLHEIIKGEMIFLNRGVYEAITANQGDKRSNAVNYIAAMYLSLANTYRVAQAKGLTYILFTKAFEGKCFGETQESIEETKRILLKKDQAEVGFPEELQKWYESEQSKTIIEYALVPEFNKYWARNNKQFYGDFFKNKYDKYPDLKDAAILLDNIFINYLKKEDSKEYDKRYNPYFSKYIYSYTLKFLPIKLKHVKEAKNLTKKEILKELKEAVDPRKFSTEEISDRELQKFIKGQAGSI
ncbi:MAG: hypothetical protein AAF770_00920 [Bacteroidota bacterium]